MTTTDIIINKSDRAPDICCARVSSIAFYERKRKKNRINII